MTKADIIKTFQRNPDRYWKVNLFNEMGFARKRCDKCGKHFWTLTEQKTCNDATCRPYDFIGSPPAKKMDYFDAWSAVEKFFTKKNHTALKAYPVVNRWFPGLYFTIAGIVDFYRKEGDELVFEFPANPNILLQPCLRFNDVQNTGLNGKSYSCFEMIQQSSLYNGKEGYWKNECVALDFELLTKVFGIPAEEIVFIEDAWLGPNAFGSSLEYYVQGLELGNCVFTEFVGTPDNHREMKNRVIDMGAGFERFVWISNGTPTSYDVVFGPVIKELMKKCDIDYDKDFMHNYSKLSGTLNIDEVADLGTERKRIASLLKIPPQDIEKKISPLEGIYSIADHTRTLLFAISDGGLPSNVAGGYNLRVILRRALSIIEKFGWDINLADIVAMHAKYLKKRYPHLKKNMDTVANVFDAEEKRYRQTKEKSAQIIQSFGGREIKEEELLKLYDSKGITPEQLGVNVPENFYKNLTEKHMNAAKEKEREKKKITFDVSRLNKTRPLYYENPYMFEFDATIIKRLGDWVILDSTCFYPEGGGQPADKGTLVFNNISFEVIDTQKLSGVILHKLKKASGIREKQRVHGKIDWDRRSALMKMHDATHIVAGAARKVIGSHIWQAGAQKGTQVSRLDLTHYLPFTKEETEEIERVANETVRKNLPITATFLHRGDAEKKYGFSLYQGGAPAGKEIRVIDIGNGFDTEACGGTHGFKTEDVELIKIVRTERIQDGVNRVEFKAGPQALEFVKEERNMMESIAKEALSFSHSLQGISEKIIKEQKEKEHAFVSRQLMEGAEVLSVERKQLFPAFTKFTKEIRENSLILNKLRKKMGEDEKHLEDEDFFAHDKIESLSGLCAFMFNLWKQQKKQIESIRGRQSEAEAKGLIEKSRKGEIFEIVDGERNDLIETAKAVLSIRPDLTVILANQAGDVVGMSRKKDMAELVGNICRQSGGSGGGSKEFAQGKTGLSKLLKIIEKRKN